MKTCHLVAAFAAGCVLLVLAFGIGWADWWQLSSQERVIQVLAAATLADVALLVVLGIINRGRPRWFALLLASVPLLGLSGLTMFSVGWLTAPFGLILLAVSLWKLRRRRTKPNG